MLLSLLASLVGLAEVSAKQYHFPSTTLVLSCQIMQQPVYHLKGMNMHRNRWCFVSHYLLGLKSSIWLPVCLALRGMLKFIQQQRMHSTAENEISWTLNDNSWWQSFHNIWRWHGNHTVLSRFIWYVVDLSTVRHVCPLPTGPYRKVIIQVAAFSLQNMICAIFVCVWYLRNSLPIPVARMERKPCVSFKASYQLSLKRIIQFKPSRSMLKREWQHT